MESLDLKDVAQIDQQYKNIVYGFIKQVLRLFPSDNPYYNFDGLISSLCLLYYFNKINSKILTIKETSEFLNLLDKENKFTELGNFKWNLIYRFSDDAFNLDIFRYKCHGLTDIVAIIRSDTNNVFGGYLSVGWKEWNNHFDHTRDENAFLFLIRSSKDYPMEIFDIVKTPKYASCIADNDVCIFGGGWDLNLGRYCTRERTGSVAGLRFGTTEGYLNADQRYFIAEEIECFHLS